MTTTQPTVDPTLSPSSEDSSFASKLDKFQLRTLAVETGGPKNPRRSPRVTQRNIHISESSTSSPELKDEIDLEDPHSSDDSDSSDDSSDSDESSSSEEEIITEYRPSPSIIKKSSLSSRSLFSNSPRGIRRISGSGPCTIEDLDDYSLSLILRQLSIDELNRASNTCRRWKRVSVQLLRSVIIPSASFLNHQRRAMFAQFSGETVKDVDIESEDDVRIRIPEKIRDFKREEPWYPDLRWRLNARDFGKFMFCLVFFIAAIVVAIVTSVLY